MRPGELHDEESLAKGAATRQNQSSSQTMPEKRRTRRHAESSCYHTVPIEIFDSEAQRSSVSEEEESNEQDSLKRHIESRGGRGGVYQLHPLRKRNSEFETIDDPSQLKKALQEEWMAQNREREEAARTGSVRVGSPKRTAVVVPGSADTV